VLFVPPVVAGADEVAAAIHAAVERGATDKPVLAVLISRDGTPSTLREGRSSVASFAYPESAARALGLAAARAEWLRRPAGTAPPPHVQPMISGGAELLAGIVREPVFGPLVAFGPGGVFADLIGAAALRIAPLTDVDVKELVQEGKAGRLVAGFRGAPASDAP